MSGSSDHNLDLPPLLNGLELDSHADPFLKARAEAAIGCDAGLVIHALSPDRMRAAIVLAPETPLEQAMAALPACGTGLQNALGALAPPEVAVHLSWDGGIRVNGARCGSFQTCAAQTDPAETPDWLVVGFDLPLLPPYVDDPGQTPDQTGLLVEGCADLDPPRLLESWARHTLHWLTGLEQTGGRAALHREWRGLLWQMGETVTQPHAGTTLTGKFMGVDEDFGMLLRDDAGATHLLPLSALLQRS